MVVIGADRVVVRRARHGRKFPSGHDHQVPDPPARFGPRPEVDARGRAPAQRRVGPRVVVEVDPRPHHPPGVAPVLEFVLLQEAGFHPLEVIQAATLNGAELLGMDDQIGAITKGRQADLVLVKGNPIANFKLLYGTGHMYLDRKAGEVTRVGGVSQVIKSGIVYDAKQLLDDVRAMVREARDAK